MSAKTRSAAAIGSTAAALVLLAGCADGGDIGLHNDSDEAVTVELGGDASEELAATSGVVLLEQDECIDGPLIVTYDSGRVLEVDGPLCPGEALQITAQDAAVEPAS